MAFINIPADPTDITSLENDVAALETAVAQAEVDIDDNFDTLNTDKADKVLGKKIGANFNVTTDQAITIESDKYIIRKIIATNASIELDTAEGGIYTDTAKGGVDLVAATQAYTALTTSAKYADLTLEAEVGTDVRTEGTLYLSLTAAQGAAATADIFIIGDDIG
jgi:hypothetical protein